MAGLRADGGDAIFPEPGNGGAPARPPNGPKPPENGGAGGGSGLTSEHQFQLLMAQTYGGREVVAVALVVVIGAFALALIAFRDGTAVAAALGSITTLIGTLVGSFFGFQAGNQGREKAVQEAQTANKTAVAAAAFVPKEQVPDFLAEVHRGNPNVADF